MFYDVLSNPASRERLRASSIVNQPWPRLLPLNGAQWSIRFPRFVAAGLSGCLGTPHVIGTIGGGDFEA